MKADASRQRHIYLLVILLLTAGVGLGVPPELLQFILWRITVVLVATVHALAIGGACVGLGLVVIPGRAWGQLSMVELFLISFGCGAGLLSCAVLALGLVGWGQPVGHWALLVLCYAIGLARAWRVRSGSHPPIEAAPSQPPAHFALRLALLVVATLVVVAAYAPPLLFDVTEYHLGAWADYKRTLPPGRFLAMPHNFYARFPFPVESLYFLGLSLAQPMDFAPKLLNAAFVLGCAGVVAQLLRRSGASANWQALGALLLLAHPVMRTVSLDAYIDAPATFFLLAAILALAGGFVAPAGLLFGTALATKYTIAQIFLLPFLVCYAVPAARRAWTEGARRQLLLGLALGAVPLLFWLGKNVLLYGNPLEPFFAWVFHRDNAAAIAREKFYIESHFPQPLWSLGYWSTLLPRLREFGWPLLAPVVLALGWRRLLPARPAGLWALQPVRLLVFIGLSYLLWNLVRESQNRFLLPSIALLICVGLRALAALPVAVYRQLAAALLGLWAALHVVHQGITLQNAGEFRYFAQFELVDNTDPPATPPTDQPQPQPQDLTLREQFYKDNLAALGELLPRLKELPADTEVLMVYEARPYLVPRATVYNTVWDDSELVRLATGARSGAELAARLRQAGITHVLVNREELRRYIQQYTRQSKLFELGLDVRDDPAAAFYATPTPEDLYPPFYRDPAWPDVRAAILEFLATTRATATAATGRPPLEIYLAPVQPQ